MEETIQPVSETQAPAINLDEPPQEEAVEIPSDELIPSSKHPDKVGKRVFEIFAAVISDKKELGLHDRWKRNYNLSRNKHWNQAGTANVPLISANLLFIHKQRTVNSLTDNNPTFNVVRTSETNEGDPEANLYLDLQRTCEHWWNDQEQQDVLAGSVDVGEMYGIVGEKVIFNKDLEGGQGEAETITLDPYEWGFYPVKLRNPRDLQKCEAVLHFYPMSVRSIKRKWGKAAAAVKSDEEFLAELGDDRREINSPAGSKSNSLIITIANVIKEVANFFTGDGGLSADAETLVVELWCKDYTLLQKGDNIEDKYPGNIRCIVACSAGKVVLEDRKNPNVNWFLPIEEARKTYLFGRYPFGAANSVRDTSNAWGASDYEQLEQLNQELDKALSQLVLDKDRASRRIIKNPKTSGVPDDEFVNFPAIIHPANANESAAITYMELPGFPQDLPASISLFKELFFLVAGTFELDQAQVQGREVIAYKAIAALLERAATMQRGKIRSYSRLIRERGRMFVSHVMNFYGPGRWITFRGRDGVEQSKQIDGNKLRIPAKITVVDGSTMPVSNIQKREEAISLFDKRAIDQEELLNALDYSGRADVIKRMKGGVYGAALDRLKQIGVPAPILDMISKLIILDPKEFQRALEQGKLPSWANFLASVKASMAGQGEPQIPPKEQAEIRKLVADAMKIDADRQLSEEKIFTERVDQQVKLAGVKFDDDQLAIERAKTIGEIEARAKDVQTERTALALDHVNKEADRQTSVAATQEEPPVPVSHESIADGLPDLPARPMDTHPGFTGYGIKSDNVTE